MSYRIGAKDIGFAGAGFLVAFVLLVGIGLAFPIDGFSPENFPCHKTEALQFVPDSSERTHCVSLLDWPETPPTFSSSR
jgi:hypothetical protein